MTKRSDSFLSSDSLTKGELIGLTLYLMLSAVVWKGESIFPEYGYYKNFVFGYAFSGPFIIYQFCYKSLRKKSFTIVCFAICLVHVALYFSLIDNPGLQQPRGPIVSKLWMTLLFLTLFQLLRYFHLKYFKGELVAPNGTGYDTFDNKKNGLGDNVSFLLFIAIWMLSLFLI